MFKLIFLLAISFTNAYSTVGFGTFVPAVGKYQNKEDGSTDSFRINPYISFHYPIPIFGEQYFYPEIGYVFYTGLEEEYSKRTLFLLYNFAWRFQSPTYLRYGFGTFMTSVKGEGGTAELANGNSTQTFYKPSEKRTTYNTTLNLGIEHFFINNYAGRLEAYVFEFLSSEKRNIGYSLSFNFYY